MPNEATNTAESAGRAPLLPLPDTSAIQGGTPPPDPITDSVTGPPIVVTTPDRYVPPPAAGTHGSLVQLASGLVVPSSITESPKISWPPFLNEEDLHRYMHSEDGQVRIASIEPDTLTSRNVYRIQLKFIDDETNLPAGQLSLTFAPDPQIPDHFICTGSRIDMLKRGSHYGFEMLVQAIRLLHATPAITKMHLTAVETGRHVWKNFDGFRLKPYYLQTIQGHLVAMNNLYDLGLTPENILKSSSPYQISRLIDLGIPHPKLLNLAGEAYQGFGLSEAELLKKTRYPGELALLVLESQSQRDEDYVDYRYESILNLRSEADYQAFEQSVENFWRARNLDPRASHQSDPAPFSTSTILLRDIFGASTNPPALSGPLPLDLSPGGDSPPVGGEEIPSPRDPSTPGGGDGNNGGGVKPNSLWPAETRFLRPGQAEEILDLLKVDDQTDPHFLDAALGVVSFLGCGAITAASVWLHRRNFPESALHLVGLAREESPTAYELMSSGTNFRAFKSKSLQVNVEGQNNLIAITDPDAKKILRDKSGIIFLNTKMEELLEEVTEDWIGSLHPTFPYTFPNFIKSFEDENGLTAFEALEERFVGAGRSDLIDKIAVIAGYTSAPKVIQPGEEDSTFHIEIVVSNAEAAHRILRFFVPEGVEPTVHPSVIGQPEEETAPKNFYHTPHLDVTLTIGTRDDVVAAGLGGALKNPLVIKTGYDLFNLYADLEDGASTAFLSALRKQANDRRHADLDYVRQFLDWEGITTTISKAVEEDILSCSRANYNKLYRLTRQVWELAKRGDVIGIKKLIQEIQADVNQPFGSRNMQVGIYLGIAALCVKMGIADFPEEIFDPEEPEHWKVQEGVPGIRNLWKRHVIPGNGLYHGVKAGSARAQGEQMPQHIDDIRLLVLPEYTLPIDGRRLKLYQRLVRSVRQMEWEEDSGSEAQQRLAEGLRALQNGLNQLASEVSAARFKGYIENLSHLYGDISQALKTVSVDMATLTQVARLLRESIQFFANLDEKSPRIGAALSKIKNKARSALALLSATDKKGIPLGTGVAETGLMSDSMRSFVQRGAGARSVGTGKEATGTGGTDEVDSTSRPGEPGKGGGSVASSGTSGALALSQGMETFAETESEGSSSLFAIIGSSQSTAVQPIFNIVGATTSSEVPTAQNDNTDSTALASPDNERSVVFSMVGGKGTTALMRSTPPVFMVVR